jgi:hypothetical protein
MTSMASLRGVGELVAELQGDVDRRRRPRLSVPRVRDESAEEGHVLIVRSRETTDAPGNVIRVRAPGDTETPHGIDTERGEHTALGEIRGPKGSTVDAHVVGPSKREKGTRSTS